MNFFKNVFIAIILCITLCIDAKRSGAAPVSYPSTTPSPSPSSAPAIQQQSILASSPMTKPTSYAQALEVIKRMKSNEVLVNNTIAQKFIDFVQSLNLSDIEKKGLLEAGAHIHAIWNSNDQLNKQTISSLKNTIAALAPTAPTTRPTILTQPGRPTAPPKSTQPLRPQPVVIGKPMEHHLGINNVMLVLDPNQKELIDKPGAMVSITSIALYQNAAPIIITSNILEIMITIKKKVGEENLKKLRTLPADQVTPLAEDLLKQNGMESTIDYKDLEIIAHIDFNNINYYFHKSEKLVLLIPKKFISSQLPNSSKLNLVEQVQACGFNPTPLKSITNTTNENLLKELQIQQSMNIDSEQFIPHLTSLFTIQKKHGQLLTPEQDIKWVMYLTGHGDPSSTLENIRKELAENKNKPTPAVTPRTRNFEKILREKSSLPNSQLIQESAQIAGIPANDFIQLMKFFNTNLNMAYLHYDTCFSGGSNQSFVNETLSLFNVNFIISALGINETTTAGNIHENISEQGPRIQIQGQSYSEFFKLTQSFFVEPEKFVKLKGKKQDPIAFILQTITPSIEQQNQLFIRFPATESFKGISAFETTKIITQVMEKAHEAENKPFNFINAPDYNSVIIVYPTRINVPLDLGVIFACIAFPSPKNIIPKYESIHIFKRVLSELLLPYLIGSFIISNAKIYPQTIILRTLDRIHSYEELTSLKSPTNKISNLIIHLEPVFGSNPSLNEETAIQPSLITAHDIKINDIGANIHVALEYSDTLYQSSFGIKSFESEKLLHGDFDVLIFTQVAKTPDAMNALAKNFLKPNEIAQLAKPITLEAIANFIDKKIDTQDQSMEMTSEADMQALAKTIEEKAKKANKK